MTSDLVNLLKRDLCKFMKQTGHSCFTVFCPGEGGSGPINAHTCSTEERDSCCVQEQFLQFIASIGRNKLARKQKQNLQANN